MKTKLIALTTLILAVCLFVIASAPVSAIGIGNGNGNGNGQAFMQHGNATSTANAGTNDAALRAMIAELQAKIKNLMNSLNAQRGGNATGTAAMAPADLYCVKAAVGVREGATLADYRKMTASIDSALSKRGADLVAAWGLTNNAERKAAIKKADSTFAEAKRTAQSIYKKAEIATWKTYKEAVKACKAVDLDDKDTEKADEI